MSYRRISLAMLAVAQAIFAFGAFCAAAGVQLGATLVVLIGFPAAVVGLSVGSVADRRDPAPPASTSPHKLTETLDLLFLATQVPSVCVVILPLVVDNISVPASVNVIAGILLTAGLGMRAWGMAQLSGTSSK